MTKVSIIETLFLALLLVTPATQAVVLDFEDFGVVDFTHGTVVNSQYDSAAFGNVTITSQNADNQGPDLAVAFDSSTKKADTTDDDLVAPFGNTSLGDLAPGNILIIQENNTGCLADGICNDPDDEGARPSGKLTINFASVVELLSLDFFDIENVENNDHADSKIRFYDGMDNELFANTYFVPGTGGDNTWDRLSFVGISGISKLEINLRGSGAIDNLTYNVVPVPAAVWLFGTALLGFIGFSRRTAI
jgi:hypothetical protein